MTEGGSPRPADDGLSARLESLQRDYSARLDALELGLPPPGPTPPAPARDYFPDEPAPAPARNYFPEEPPQAPAVPAAPPEPKAQAAPEPAPSVRLLEPPTALPEELPKVEAPAPRQPSESPRPLPRPPSVLWPTVGPLSLGIAAAAVAAALLAAGRLGGLFGPRAPSFVALPSDGLSALASDGLNLYAFDPAKEALITVSPVGRVWDGGPLPGGAVAGLARDSEGSFWTTSPDHAALYERGSDAARSVRKIYPYPNRRFGALAVSGDALWTLDAQTGAAYQYLLGRSLLGTSLTPVSEFDGFPETARAVGLHVEGGLLWVCDPQLRLVTRYRPAGSALTAVDTFDLSPWILAESRLEGMAVAAGSLWVLSGSPSGVRRFPLKSLSWRPIR